MITTTATRNRAVSVVVESWDHVFAEPVRSGRIRMRGWPRPLQVIIVIVTALYGLTSVAVLASGLLRRIDPAVDLVGLSVWAWPMITVDLWLSMVLLYLATLQLHPAIRVASWAGCLVPHLTLIGGMVLGLVELTSAGSTGLILLLICLVAMLSGGIALIVLAVVGPRRPTAVGTVLAAALAFAGTYLVPQLSVGVLSDVASATPGVAMLLLMAVALPLSVAAGTAFAQVSINACTWVLLSVRREVTGRAWLPMAVLLGIAAVGWNVITAIRSVSWAEAGWTLAEVGLCFALSAFGLRQAREVGPFDIPRPTALAERLGRISMILGVLLGCWFLPLLLDLVLPLPATITNNSSVGADFLLAIGAGIMAVRAARGGRAILATLLPPVAVTGAYAGVRTLFDLPTLQSSVSNLLVCAALIIAAVIWRRQRPLDVDRLFVLSVGFLVVLAFPWRQQLAEPIAALLGFSLVGVLFFGLLWRLLTDAEFTYRETPRFPGGARLLTFLAYAIFAAAAMAVTAFRGENSMLVVVDLDNLAQIGDAIIGFGLSVAVVVGLIELGRFGVDLEPDDDAD